MQITQKQHGGVVILELAGPLTYGTQAVWLADKVESLLFQGERHIVLNLGGVGQVDSAGLGALIAVRAKAQRHRARVVLANVNTRARDLLVMTRLLTAFETYDGEAQAVESFPVAA
jgi:anti-sigma B factor antagonist